MMCLLSVNKVLSARTLGALREKRIMRTPKLRKIGGSGGCTGGAVGLLHRKTKKITPKHVRRLHRKYGMCPHTNSTE